MSIFESVMADVQMAERRERDAIAERALLQARKAAEFAVSAKTAVAQIEKLLEQEKNGIISSGGTSTIDHNIFSSHYVVSIKFTFPQSAAETRIPPEFEISIRGGEAPGKYTVLGHGKLDMKSNYSPSQLGQEITVVEEFNGEPLKKALREIYTEAVSFYKPFKKSLVTS